MTNNGPAPAAGPFNVPPPPSPTIGNPPQSGGHAPMMAPVANAAWQSPPVQARTPIHHAQMQGPPGMHMAVFYTIS